MSIRTAKVFNLQHFALNCYDPLDEKKHWHLYRATINFLINLVQSKQSAICWPRSNFIVAKKIFARNKTFFSCNRKKIDQSQLIILLAVEE